MTLAHLGEILSVLAALCWAVSVVLFRMSGRHFPPFSLNFFKNIIASILMLATLAVLREDIVRDVPASDYVLLALSGVLGIAVADTLFFRSLNIVGAGLSQLVGLSYSPFIIVLTFLFLGERLTLGDFAGAGLIITGILITASPQHHPEIKASELRKGIGIATLSVAMMAVGVLLAKPALNRNPVLWSTTIRLLAGVAAMMLLTLVSPRRRYVWRTLRPSPSWKVAIPAAFIGAYLAMLTWIGGMKYTQALTAAILNQTSALFVLPLAAVFLKERITARKLIAVSMAVAGVVVVTIF